MSKFRDQVAVEEAFHISYKQTLLHRVLSSIRLLQMERLH
jgi:hypothetical protein